jgi:Kef-type K+ transport system membrane component KefB
LPDLKILLLDIVVICSLARLLGWGFEGLHQPRVVGEMLAGILLGPSLLGWLAPRVFASLFPASGLAPLYFLSQIGLVLFMFQVGLELDLQALHRLGRTVVITSSMSVLVPLLAGSVLALYLYPRLSSANVPLAIFAVFMGTAMSITAFPVLARILKDHNLSATRIGHVAVACAAFNDVVAWVLLAYIVGASITPVVIYSVVMWVVVRPLLRFVPNELPTMLVFVFLSSWATDLVGLHALFGAFCAGVVWPRGSVRFEEVSDKIEPIAMAVLIPLFFSYTGLRTNLGSVNWGYTAIIVAVAVLAKVGGAFAGAKLMGFDVKNSFALGCLLNTRGLVELVVLNVGLDLGMITPALFSMFVAMALITTLMTSPALSALKLSEDAPVPG